MQSGLLGVSSALGQLFWQGGKGCEEGGFMYTGLYREMAQ